MELTIKRLGKMFIKAGSHWSSDEAPVLGASLAFYTLFSLSPLLVIIISIAGLWFSHNASQQIFDQIGGLIGTENAHSLQKMLVQPQHQKQGIMAASVATVMLIFGATGVFVQLQNAFNHIWEVKQKPGQGVRGFIRHRLLSFAMVLGIGFLLLVSLIVTAGMAAFGKFMTSHLGNVEWLWQILNNIVSFGVIALLFALMFKYLPDVKIDWEDVWAGAFVTALLFTMGKYLLGMYIGKSSLVSTYAAAGSLIVVLLWVYYSAQILFFGAELTQVFACESGRRAQPTSNAVWDESKKAAGRVTNWEEIKKEEKKEEKKEREQPVPAGLPEYAFGAPATHETATRQKRLPGAAWASVAVLLVIFPIERWFSKRLRP
jgi:membrane protein